MNRRVFLALLFALLPLQAYAGEGTILETDEKIIIEYSGDDNDAKAALSLKEEREQEQSKLQAEEAKEKRDVIIQEQRAVRRATTRPERSDD
jgi:hypothetical protein